MIVSDLTTSPSNAVTARVTLNFSDLWRSSSIHQAIMLSVMSISGAESASIFHLATIMSSKIYLYIMIIMTSQNTIHSHLSFPVCLIGKLIHESHHCKLA